MSTVKVSTADLEGMALDWAVASAVGFPVQHSKRLGVHCVKVLRVSSAEGIVRAGDTYNPSSDWSQCGPLLEEFQLTLMLHETYEISGKRFQDVWEAGAASDWFVDPDAYEPVSTDPKIAICRAIVASKLGDTVEIPAELLEAV